MNYDDTALTRCDETFERWKTTILEREVLREIGGFVEKHRGEAGGVLDELSAPERGSFNLWFRAKFKDEEGSAVIRFPCPGASMFPEEKVQREVAVMRFLERFTKSACASCSSLWDGGSEGHRAVYYHGVYRS